MTESRQNLESKLKAFEAAKKAAKGVDDAAFLENARGVVATIREIWQLPEDNVLTGFQVSSYCWALYALASKSDDGEEARKALARLVCAYRKKIDSPQFWGCPRNADFGRTLFVAIVVQVGNLVKHANEGTADAFLKIVGVPFLEILDLRAEAFLDDDAFRKDPVTEAQRQSMECHTGKKIRLKAWPSIAEKAFGLMNRILKIHPTVQPSAGLVSFLSKNVSRGDWLSYYCSKAQVRIGEYVAARQRIVEILRKKPKEGWLWSDLAEACRDRLDLAVSCLAKSLLCPNRDPQIAEGMAKKSRSLLCQILVSQNRTVPPEDLKDSFYEEEARKAESFVFGKERPLGASFGFSGVLRKKAGNAFGFVNDKTLGSVFVPPRFAEKHKDGDLINGKAEKKEDKKKKRLSWCMIAAL